MIHDAAVHKITRRNPSLQDWPYYGIIDVLNPVATAQYQHNVTIPTKPGMMHDFRDLRFFQADGTEMPFWNESQTAGSTSFNWFKPYSLSQRKAYVFYGNREAVSQSNGDRCFEFFDDFLGSTIQSQWATTTNCSVSNGICSMAASSSLKTTVEWGLNYAMRTYATIDNSHNANIGWIATGGQSWILFQGNYPNANAVNSRTGTSGGDNNMSNLGATSGYHIFEFQRDSTTKVNFLIDGTVKANPTTNIPTALMHFEFGTPASSTQSLDWILVRKHTATEPVCQLNQSGLRNPAYR